MRLVRSGDGTVIVEDLELATHFWGRLRGLMGRRELPTNAGLWLQPCSSIHMMFVPFALDVVFTRPCPDATTSPSEGSLPLEQEVLDVRPGVRAWWGLAACRGAQVAVELPAGRASALQLAAGDRLRVEVNQ